MAVTSGAGRLKSGQLGTRDSSYSTFPFIALGLVAVAAAIAWLVVHRHPAARSSEATPAPAARPPPPFDSTRPKGAPTAGGGMPYP
jgi:hypothetical protein